MNELRVFENSEFGEIRLIEIGGKPYFAAKDIAVVLGYSNTRDAVSRHCKGVVKHDILTNRGLQEMNFISEGDLYRLITHSKLPAAERFESWVFDEVLPEIRRTGSYGNGLNGLETMVMQMTRTTEMLVQVATTLSAVAGQLLCVKADTPKEYVGDVNVLASRMQLPDEVFPVGKCKVETFPPDFVEKIDGMLMEMQQQQSLNFSMIARYCTMNGYPISNPAVKTYFLRHFTEK